MRIGIIGHFGGKEQYNDGQTVKVKALYNGLRRYAPDIQIDIVDTYYFHKRSFLAPIQLSKSFILDRTIIFLPATNGRKVLFKLMNIFTKIFKKRVFHDAIGGALVKELDSNPSWVNYLNSFEGNWMESKVQVEQMREKGIINAKYIPNFKSLNTSNISSAPSRVNGITKFCMFCRVEKMKGIEEAIDAIRLANNKNNKVVATLDIFGPIQRGSDDWFKSVQETMPIYCNYRGNANPEESVAILSNYHAMLFPTRYYSEGMPGSIIDSMFAGVPVIARNWAYCDQMITNGYNGFSYAFESPELLPELISYVIQSPNTLDLMRENCLEESRQYTEEVVMGQILVELGLKR